MPQAAAPGTDAFTVRSVPPWARPRELAGHQHHASPQPPSGRGQKLHRTFALFEKPLCPPSAWKEISGVDPSVLFFLTSTKPPSLGEQSLGVGSLQKAAHPWPGKAHQEQPAGCATPGTCCYLPVLPRKSQGNRQVHRNTRTLHIYLKKKKKEKTEAGACSPFSPALKIKTWFSASHLWAENQLPMNEHFCNLKIVHQVPL